MNIRTTCGISIYCLPDNAKCKCTGKSPLEMDSCPINNFDDYGNECIPGLCKEYGEE